MLLINESEKEKKEIQNKKEDNHKERKKEEKQTDTLFAVALMG